MNKHIAYVTDMYMGDGFDNPTFKSGYANLGVEICRQIVSYENEVKVLGYGYKGQEHREAYSIIPCAVLQDVVNNVDALRKMWRVDVVIVAFDIHSIQEKLIPVFKDMGLPYICITPLESDPLAPSWANLLQRVGEVLFISQFGANEAQKAGVDAKHLEIGIDTRSWRRRTAAEYVKARQAFGIQEDEFAVLTVADNQERKNLSDGAKIVKKLKELGVKVRHVLVTREISPVGWNLYDLAFDLGISAEMLVIRSGVPFEQLYIIYCTADAFLLCSSGEGLGVPILESMSVGVPVVANRTGAIPELLGEDRGWVIPSVFEWKNPFGGQNRYFIDKDKAVEALLGIKDKHPDVNARVENARKYVESRSWEKTGRQIEEAVERVAGNATSLTKK